MDRKAILDKVITAIATSVILGVLGFFMGVFEKGATAINEDQITAVLEKVLKTDSGQTYRARLSEVDGQLIGIETRVGILTKDVDDLEGALRDLTAP